MKTECREINSDNECIPLGILENKWIECSKAICPLNDDLINENTQEVIEKEENDSLKQAEFDNWKRRKYRAIFKKDGGK